MVMADTDKIFIAKWFIILVLQTAFVLQVASVLPTASVEAGGFRSFEQFQRGNPADGFRQEIHVAISATVVPRQVQPGGLFNLYVQVDLPQDWHIYSLENSEGSLPTRIQLEETPFTPQGGSGLQNGWKESPPRIAMDGVLQKMVKTHEKTAQFTLPMQAPGDLPPGVFPIAGTLTYRLCDNKVCYLPKELSFQATVQVATAKR